MSNEINFDVWWATIEPKYIRTALLPDFKELAQKAWDAGWESSIEAYNADVARSVYQRVD